MKVINSGKNITFPNKMQIFLHFLFTKINAGVVYFAKSIVCVNKSPFLYQGHLMDDSNNEMAGRGQD
jgi:hypothetical protein